MRTSADDFYGDPLHHDIVHAGTADETASGVRRALEQLGVKAGSRIVEPGVGTGRIAGRLADAGYIVGGFDSDERALEFARDLPWGSTAEFVHRSFTTVEHTDFIALFDAAYCPMSSLAHLLGREQLRTSIDLVLDLLVPEAPYIIGMTFRPASGETSIEEHIWRGERDGRRVTQQLQYIPEAIDVQGERIAVDQVVLSEIVEEGGDVKQRSASTMLRSFTFDEWVDVVQHGEIEVGDCFDLHGAKVESGTPGYRQVVVRRRS